MKRIAPLALVLPLLLLGCASTSRIYFEEPAGAELTLMPVGSSVEGVVVEFPQAQDLRQQPLRRDVELRLPEGPELRGYLLVHPKLTSPVEELALVSFKLTPEQIAKLEEGHAVTITGISAEGKKVYTMYLGLDR